MLLPSISHNSFWGPDIFDFPFLARDNSQCNNSDISSSGQVSSISQAYFKAPKTKIAYKMNQSIKPVTVFSALLACGVCACVYSMCMCVCVCVHTYIHIYPPKHTDLTWLKS